MKVNKHWLQTDELSENIVIKTSQNARDLIDPDYLIIHYTATDTANEALNWFLSTPPANPDRIAAHIIIDPEGKITQLVPFNRRANHAGASTWDGTDNLNYHSIGIELVNPGFVEKLADGSFRRAISNTKFKTYPASTANSVMPSSHKHKFWADKLHWFAYPEAQMAALNKLAKCLVEHYQLIEVLGHDDISPARKSDPGPAFPWETLRTAATKVSSNTGKIFIVNTPGTHFRVSFTKNSASIKTLPMGYETGLIETMGNWSKVYLVNKSSDVLLVQGKSRRGVKAIGWIHSSLLTVKADQK